MRIVDSLKFDQTLLQVDQSRFTDRPQMLQCTVGAPRILRDAKVCVAQCSITGSTMLTARSNTIHKLPPVAAWSGRKGFFVHPVLLSFHNNPQALSADLYLLQGCSDSVHSCCQVSHAFFPAKTSPHDAEIFRAEFQHASSLTYQMRPLQHLPTFELLSLMRHIPTFSTTRR